MNEPRECVSVIIPTYYRNDALRDTIESALQQDYEPLEIIVVDDSGEDHARELVDEYDVTYLSHTENKGANPARNTGIRHSTGRYIQLLDDDDLLYADKISQQVTVMESSADTGVVYCGVDLEENGRLHSVLPNPDMEGDVLEEALTFDTFPCVNPTMLIDRKALEEVLPLKSRPSADDTGMMIELAQIAEFRYVNEPLVRKKHLGDNRGQGLVNALERLNIISEYEHLYEQYPDRVKRTALSDAYRKIGGELLNQNTWSARGTLAYWTALYYHPDPSPLFVGACVASLFGSPGIDASKFIWEKFGWA